MRRLYLAVALPKIVYGLDVWYSPPNKPTGSTRNEGSVGTLKLLQKLQRIASIAITGALRTTPTDLIDAHAGILPMELAILKVCHRAAVRLLTLPKSHPLFGIVRDAKASRPARHQSAIDGLIKLFNLQHARLETITPTTSDPYRPQKFSTKIAGSRDSSIREEKGDKADFKIFTDGSNHDGGVGAAAVIYRRGQPWPLKHLKAHLGPATTHNNYEAEAVGGILAMWLVTNTPDTIGKAVSVFSDSQALLRAIASPRPASGQYLIQDLRNKASNAPAKIRFNWISAHSKVRGNEKADVLAKEAAEGRANGRQDLPPLLRNPLPISASSLKQEFHSTMKSRWNTEWLESPRRGRIEQLDDTFPFNGYRERQYKLSRTHASLLLQVRSGHLPLNFYLHRMNKTESKCCQACKDDLDDVTPTESITHFIYDCKAYAPQRRILVRKVGASNIALKDIMLETKRMRALAQYIVATGRFTATTNNIAPATAPS